MVTEEELTIRRHHTELRLDIRCAPPSPSRITRCTASWPPGPFPAGRCSSVSRSPRVSPAGGPHCARQLSFGFEGPDGAFTTLGSLDGHYLSTEVADGFTGRVNGIYAAEGTAHFDWVDHEPVAP
jgi:xylan 1,4-beta-xylosidase